MIVPRLAVPRSFLRIELRGEPEISIVSPHGWVVTTFPVPPSVASKFARESARERRRRAPRSVL